MEPKRTNKTYSPAFKREALALIYEQGYSVPEAALALGIRSNILYRWKKEDEERQSGISVSGAERSELIRLRREVKNLRMEKEILKKAATFFAKKVK